MAIKTQTNGCIGNSEITSAEAFLGKIQDADLIRDFLLNRGKTSFQNMAGYLPGVTDCMDGIEQYGRDGLPILEGVDDSIYYYSIDSDEYDYGIWNNGKNITMFDGSMTFDDWHERDYKWRK